MADYQEQQQRSFNNSPGNDIAPGEGFKLDQLASIMEWGG